MENKKSFIVYTLIMCIIDIIAYGTLFIVPAIYMSDEITYMLYFLLICPIICFFVSAFNILSNITKVLNILIMAIIFSGVIYTMYSEMIFVCLLEYILIAIYVYISMKYLLEKAAKEEEKQLI